MECAMEPFGQRRNEEIQGEVEGEEWGERSGVELCVRVLCVCDGECAQVHVRVCAQGSLRGGERRRRRIAATAARRKCNGSEAVPGVGPLGMTWRGMKRCMCVYVCV